MDQRRLARHAAMSLLYERELGGDNSSETLLNMADIFQTDKITPELTPYIDIILRNYDDDKEQIDNTIESYCRSYTLSRLSKVDLCILRLAVIEMLYTDIPAKVSLNEAVEMAKRFSGEKSPGFVNGVLASFVKDKGLA